MRFRKHAKHHLLKARETAKNAVATYNNPHASFRCDGYVMTMVVAWTALLHAVFYQRGVQPCYLKRDSSKIYEVVDGERKKWELATCVAEYFSGTTSPVEANLKFFIGLRNKIEHSSLYGIDETIFGECQALLYNFEDIIHTEFGDQWQIGESLAISLQMSRVRDGSQGAALKRLHQHAARSIVNYVDDMRSSLSSDVVNDQRFAYKVLLLPRISGSGRAGDLAVQWIEWDESNPEAMQDYERVVTFIRDRHAPIANKDLMRAGDVAKQVQQFIRIQLGLDQQFSASAHHVKAWKLYGVRPSTGVGDPRKTDSKYCIYDQAHGDYLYTPAWVRFLCDQCREPDELERILRFRS